MNLPAIDRWYVFMSFSGLALIFSNNHVDLGFFLFFYNLDVWISQMEWTINEKTKDGGEHLIVWIFKCVGTYCFIYPNFQLIVDFIAKSYMFWIKLFREHI